MSNRSGSPYSLPRDADRVPAVGAVKASDGVTVQPLEVDNAGNLLVNVAASAIVPLVNETFDSISRTNPDANGNYQTMTFSYLGSPVVVLTFTYDSSSNVTGIVRS